MVVGETHHFRKQPYKHSMGVSKNRYTPKWMAFLMEIPIKLDDLGGVFPTILGNTPYISIGSISILGSIYIHRIHIYIYIGKPPIYLHLVAEVSQDGRLVAAKQLKTAPESLDSTTWAGQTFFQPKDFGDAFRGAKRGVSC